MAGIEHGNEHRHEHGNANDNGTRPRTGTGTGQAAQDPRHGRWRRRLHRTVQAHVQTWRPYTLAHPALVGVAGASTAGAAGRPGTLALAAGAPGLGWLAGHYLGDYFDRHLDAIAKPQRPIPSGRLSPEAALAGGVVCAAGSALILAAVDWRTLLLFALAMAGIVAYSRICKGRGISGNLVRGALTALAFVVGTMLARPDPPWRVLLPALIFLLHDTSSNLVGTIRDVDGDRAGGYLSVPVRHGVDAAARLALALYAGATAVGAVCAVLLPMAHRSGYAVLFVVAAGIGAASFAPLLRQTRAVTEAAAGSRPRTQPHTRTPAQTQEVALRAHKVLVVERLVLTAAVIAAGTGARTVLLLLVPVLLFSVVTQRTMRSRHELPPQPSPAGPATPGTERKAYQP